MFLFFSLCFSFFLWLLGFLASWLFGFLASWLLGFLAFRLLNFSASGLLGFSAFCWFMRLLLAFWLFASSAFPVPLQHMRLLAVFGGFGVSLPSGFLAFAPFHWFLDMASRIISLTTTLFESSLLRTS